MLSQLVKELAIHGSEQIPVATPSRALAEFWGRYRKPKPHVNPMMPAGSTSEETSASTNPMMDSSAVHPTDPVTPAGTEGTVHSTVVPSSTGPTDGAVSGGADASTGVPVDGAVSGGADASTGVPVHVGLDKREAHLRLHLKRLKVVGGMMKNARKEKLSWHRQCQGMQHQMMAQQFPL